MERAYVPDASPYEALIALAREGTPAALATVVDSDGSTPQVPGAGAVFTAEGLACGTVGGGVGEARVEALALRALKTGASLFRTLDLGHDPSAEGEAICGGRLRVLIDARPGRHVPVFFKMMEAVKKTRPGLLAVWIQKGRGPGAAEVRRFWLPERFGRADLAETPLTVFEAPLRAAARTGRPSLIAAKDGRLYIEPHAPLPRLVIAGGGHVGRAVAHLGRLLNFEIIIIDDRPEFANPGRFPEAGRIAVADEGRMLRTLPLGPDAFVVIVTRGHRHDEEALRACVRRKAAYIGMIGSARKVGLLRDRFLENGWCSPAEWDRVRTPIGLPIGSRTVEEIAVSIAAELVAVRSRLRAVKGLDPADRGGRR
jgi:xanthine dehydrogenase accessory factor